MQIVIGDVLSAAEVADARAVLDAARFADGRATAGWAARRVKDNEQAEGDMAVDALRETIEARLHAHALFALATRPKIILGPMFSRYAAGHAYGAHVDDAMIDGVRTDVSFTLFLAEPDSYDGGELVIDSAAGEEAVKLPAGSLIAYPSTALHRVAPVTRGTRLAAVGWVRSLVRDAHRREILFDLETARRRLYDRHGASADFDLLSKCAAHLMRLWCED
jgi:PKHD-type hydroxylase